MCTVALPHDIHVRGIRAKHVPSKRNVATSININFFGVPL